MTFFFDLFRQHRDGRPVPELVKKSGEKSVTPDPAPLPLRPEPEKSEDAPSIEP
jgi:hypothetical protein